MCLAVPVQLISVEGSVAQAELGGIRREISVLLVPEVQAGDYVLVHAGYAIQAIDEAEAEATLELLRQVAEEWVAAGSGDDEASG